MCVASDRTRDAELWTGPERTAAAGADGEEVRCAVRSARVSQGRRHVRSGDDARHHGSTTGVRANRLGTQLELAVCLVRGVIVSRIALGDDCNQCHVSFRQASDPSSKLGGSRRFWRPIAANHHMAWRPIVPVVAHQEYGPKRVMHDVLGNPVGEELFHDAEPAAPDHDDAGAHYSGGGEDPVGAGTVRRVDPGDRAVQLFVDQRGFSVDDSGGDPLVHMLCVTHRGCR